MLMAGISEGDELIDVVVRLPRKAVESTLLAIPATERELSDRRLGEAKALLTCRRRRSAFFTGLRFCDPSWDMILEVYIANCEHRQLAVAQLCSLSGGSTTTALRHIEQIEALGYISRGSDPDDRRRAKVVALPPLIEGMEQWLDLQITASRIGL